MITRNTRIENVKAMYDQLIQLDLSDSVRKKRIAKLNKMLRQIALRDNQEFYNIIGACVEGHISIHVTDTGECMACRQKKINQSKSKKTNEIFRKTTKHFPTTELYEQLIDYDCRRPYMRMIHSMNAWFVEPYLEKKAKELEEAKLAKRKKVEDEEEDEIELDLDIDLSDE